MTCTHGIIEGPKFKQQLTLLKLVINPQMYNLSTIVSWLMPTYLPVKSTRTRNQLHGILVITTRQLLVKCTVSGIITRVALHWIVQRSLPVEWLMPTYLPVKCPMALEIMNCPLEIIFKYISSNHLNWLWLYFQFTSKMHYKVWEKIFHEFMHHHLMTHLFTKKMHLKLTQQHHVMKAIWQHITGQHHLFTTNYH